MNIFNTMTFIPQWLWPFIIIWTVIWKGIALWKSARRSDKYWFIALLVLNTFGIVDIIYVYFFSEKKSEQETVSVAKEPHRKSSKVRKH